MNANGTICNIMKTVRLPLLLYRGASSVFKEEKGAAMFGGLTGGHPCHVQWALFFSVELVSIRGTLNQS